MAEVRSAEPLIRVENVTKKFGPFTALNGVSLDVYPGEVHALLGENGAGKSTLIKVLTGALGRDEGEILVDGKPVHFNTTGEAQDAGISTVYQEVNLIPAMTVAQNLTLERTGNRWGVISWRKARQEARAKLARLGLDIDIEQPVGSFSVAIQQLVAIARALVDDTRVLVLDEPTASLDANETAALFEIVRDLKSRGIAVVFITHFIDQVFEISDRITVLRNGHKVGSAPIGEFTRQKLISMMIGRELGEGDHLRAGDHSAQIGDVVLTAKDFGRSRTLQPFDLELRAGEAVGLAGLLGSGRTELTKLLFGAIKHDSGTLSYAEHSDTRVSPHASLLNGMMFCPEDRKAEGLVGELSIRENIVLSMQARQGWLKRLPYREQVRVADEMIKALAIATPDADRPVRTLSGGNQQKVVLARALACAPKILLLDEPTRGIDVGAHEEILILIRKLCAEGLALLVASSELDEIVATSDRIAVLRDRRMIGEITGDDITRDKVIEMIARENEQS